MLCGEERRLKKILSSKTFFYNSSFFHLCYCLMEENQKKKEKLEEEETHEQVFSKLPVDVFFDILSRLPLRTISQCRWVSKTWYDLILLPRFAKIHYARSIKTISPCVLLRDWKKNFYLLDHEVFDNSLTSATVWNVKLEKFKEVLKGGGRGFFCYDVVGLVNGLVCLSPDSETYSICNPVTGEYIVLPKSSKSDVQPIISGFGFDSIAEDYKVIRILEKTMTEAEAEVYSLRSGGWGDIESVPYITNKTPSNAFLNGCLHWISHQNGSKVIVSFDIGKEEFDMIHLPRYVNSNTSNTFESLGVIGECLCLIDGGFFKDMEIWVMRDYGVQGSWSMDYVLRREDVYRFWHGVYENIQLKSGEILMLNSKQNLMYYDPLEKSSRPIVIKNLVGESVVEIRQPILQVGSLISPKYVHC